MKVGVACGGTGGHVFPGLATAVELRKRGHDVVLWLSGRDIESVSTGGWDGRIVKVKAGGLPSGFSLSAVAAGAHLASAFLASVRRMRREPPNVLLAMGSYASVGPVLAARVLRIPVVLHEANAVPGRAICVLARFAVTVAVTFESSARYLAGRRVAVTGLPVRGGLDARFEEGVLRPGLFTVLVMGGSLGAHRVNEIAAEAMCRLHRAGRPVQVIHLTGAADETMVGSLYAEAGVPHMVFGFLKEMGKAYHAADLAICRAGAASCMELAVCGVPSLLVPLPSAMRDHQTANAQEMKRAGGADVMAEKDLTADRLVEYIEGRRADRHGLAGMKEALKRIAVDGAAARLADLVEQAAAGRSRRRDS